MTQNETMPVRLADVRIFAESERPGIEEAFSLLSSFQISDQDTLDLAGGALKEVAVRHDTLDKKRKAWVDPLNAVVKDINSTFRPLLDSLKAAEKAIRLKIGEYVYAQEQERTRLIQAASVAVRESPRDVEVLIAQASAVEPQKTKGVSVSMQWTGEVTDSDKIPREFMIPDVDRLLEETRKMKCDPGIPGWRGFQVPTVRSSRKGS